MRSETTSDGTRVDFIEAPDPPDDATAKKLSEAFAAIPEIQEAWVVGERVTFPDQPARTQSIIALVFDPSWNSREDLLEGFQAVVEHLRSAMAWTDRSPVSWKSTSTDALAYFWGESATKIYERT